MGPLIKIPLADRLQNAGTTAPNFLAAFEVFVSDFYTSLEEMTQNPRFSAIYDTIISPYSRRAKDGKVMELLLSEVVGVVMDELSPAERGDVLYKLLIEPFARLYDKREREDTNHE